VVSRPVLRPIDGSDMSGLACGLLGPARSTREEAADVHCGIGSLGGQRPSVAGYVAGTGTQARGNRRWRVANVAFYEAAARVKCVALVTVVPFSRVSVILLFAL